MQVFLLHYLLCDSSKFKVGGNTILCFSLPNEYWNCLRQVETVEEFRVF